MARPRAPAQPTRDRARAPSSGGRSSSWPPRRPLPPRRLSPGRARTRSTSSRRDRFSRAPRSSRDGAFPWRDILVVHGLLHDIGTGLFGSAVIEDSRWGVVAGREAAHRAALVGRALLPVRLPLLVELAVPARDAAARRHGPASSSIHYRLGLIPLVLLLLAALLHRPTVGARGRIHDAPLRPGRSSRPKRSGPLPAYLLVIVCSSSTTATRRDGSPRTSAGPGSSLASAGRARGSAGRVFLLANGALDDFVFSYRAFVPGHQLTGGRPARDLLRRSAAGERRRALRGVRNPRAGRTHPRARSSSSSPAPGSRRPLAVSDWVMLAAVAFVLPYYAKFLSRTDHVFHSFAMAVPVLSTRSIAPSPSRRRRLASVARVAGRIVVSVAPRDHAAAPARPARCPRPLLSRDAFRDVPCHFAPDVAEEPELELLGYARRGENDVTLFRDVGRALDSLLEPGDAVFDFSNTPGSSTTCSIDRRATATTT